MRITAALIVVLIMPCTALADAGQDPARGWFWYEDPVVNSPPEPQDLPADSGITPREALKRQGEEWEESMALAILEPTTENIERYMAKTEKITAQSQNFATAFKQTLWTAPQYDYSLQRPTAPEAVMAKNQYDHQDQEASLKLIAQKKGLIFFFRSDCPYCHKFAPIFKRFSEQYEFTVIPVSIDGPGLPDYPYPKKDVALGRKLNVSSVPAVFMVDPDKNELAPVGYGYRDWNVLAQQIIFADSKMNGAVALGGAP